MDPTATPNQSDPHSKRVIVDKTEWRDRLERLAEMRRVHPDEDGVVHPVFMPGEWLPS